MGHNMKYIMLWKQLSSLRGAPEKTRTSNSTPLKRSPLPIGVQVPMCYCFIIADK